ncbi:MAG: hypothetical protein ACRECL_17515 [Bradyrhizobium sp.]
MSLGGAALAVSCGTHCTLVMTVLALGCAGFVLLLLGVALPLGIALLPGVMFLPLGVMLMLLAALGVVLVLLGALLRLLAALVRHTGRILTVLAHFGLVLLLRLMLLGLPMLVRRSAGRCLSPAFRPAILFGLARLHSLVGFALARRLEALAAPGAGSLILVTGVSFPDGPRSSAGLG